MKMFLHLVPSCLLWSSTILRMNLLYSRIFLIKSFQQTCFDWLSSYSLFLCSISFNFSLASCGAPMFHLLWSIIFFWTVGEVQNRSAKKLSDKIVKRHILHSSLKKNKKSSYLKNTYPVCFLISRLKKRVSDRMADCDVILHKHDVAFTFQKKRHLYRVRSKKKFVSLKNPTYNSVCFNSISIK